MADLDLIRKTSVSKFYRAWVNMKSRCNNPKTPHYDRYGGRGIRVCKKWNKFEGFIEDMLPSYQTGLTLDRIDNNKGYFKENCKWATRKEQANNTKNIENAKRYTFNNLTLTIREWAEKTGIKRTTLGMRLQTYGWSIEKSLKGGYTYR